MPLGFAWCQLDSTAVEIHNQTMTGFSLAELARRAGVSARTVRYYIQRGLLHAPEFRGPDTQYEETHLLQLRAIRKLQDAFWPLDAISAALQRNSPEKLRAIIAGDLPKSPNSALRPTAQATPSASAAIRGERYRLADGLELWLADDADHSVRELGEAIRTFVSERLKPRTRGDR
jgi:DNA-binding transcriptional MerR regulator